MQGILPDAMENAKMYGTVSALRCLQPPRMSPFLYLKIENHRIGPISPIRL